MNGTNYNNKITTADANAVKEIKLCIVTHELGYVMSFLLDEYYRTWNPFKKRRLKKIINDFHLFMFPWDKAPLIR